MQQLSFDIPASNASAVCLPAGGHVGLDSAAGAGGDPAIFACAECTKYREQWERDEAADPGTLVDGCGWVCVTDGWIEWESGEWRIVQ